MMFKKLIEYGFCKNYWVWFHILAGGILARIFQLFVQNDWTVFFFVAIVAIVWEGYEFAIEYKRSLKKVVEIYGSKEKYLYDCIGDVLGALICAGLVLA